MDVDIFASSQIRQLDLKYSVCEVQRHCFRETDKHDGRPEVCAVHPIWSLANHSCDPNVIWEWGGKITFTAREERIDWDGKGKRKGGIMKGRKC
jgi:hypothetical protein